MEKNKGFCGRGLPLVKSLCQSLEFLGRGNVVTAVYRWTLADA
jgi:hypothetical protein